MEIANSNSQLDILKGLLTKKVGFESNLHFAGLKYAWETNIGSESPKSMDEFLKTTIYNGKSKRFGIEKQKTSGGGTPGLEIEMKKEDEPDAFYIELYNWEAGLSQDNPKVLVEDVAKLVEIKPNKDEKQSEFFKRVAETLGGEFDDNEEDGTRTINFESPLAKTKDYSVVAKVKVAKIEKGWGAKKITLDIKVPFSDMSAFLQS